MTDAPEQSGGDDPVAARPGAPVTDPAPGARRPHNLEQFAQDRRHEIEAQLHGARDRFDAVNEKLEARTGRNLFMAVLIGVALGGSMLLSLIFVKELFMVVGAVLIAFTTYELSTALRAAGRDVPRVPTVVGGVLVVPAAWFFEGPGQWYGVLAVIGVVSVWRIVEMAIPSARATRRNLVLDLAAGAFIQAYITLLGTFAVRLAAADGGEWWTLGFIILVVLVDTGAYASGLLFGKHPMAPRISPKKTWEGFAGAALLTMTGGVLIAVLMLGQDWWVGLVLGAAIVVTAVVGDLSESLIKRDLGVKDMSGWLPGHGGFLDRLDSLFPSAVIAYALFLLVA
jgi:phosphatidate cytidylyltransferase